MKTIFLSDTHGLHNGLSLEKSDLLIHAGDFSSTGSKEEVSEFIAWFSAQDARYKVFIAGNHDFLAEKDPNLFRSLLNDQIIYLENEAVEIEGIKIWGSPISPFFFNWAFNVQRGAAIREYWNHIPKDTDILVTHGPPHQILDLTKGGIYAGCEDLLEVVKEIKPRFHVFGHIHEAYGMELQDETNFINASVVNFKYKLVNAPFIIEVD